MLERAELEEQKENENLQVSRFHIEDCLSEAGEAE